MFFIVVFVAVSYLIFFFTNYMKKKTTLFLPCKYRTGSKKVGSPVKPCVYPKIIDSL